MATITFKENPVNTSGKIPTAGNAAPDFTLTGADLGDVTLANYNGKKLILNIFPSIDTGVCATSVRTFNNKASSLDNSVVLCISRDLPFAQSRFCGAEGLENVVSLSEMRDRDFGEAYGMEMIDGPLKGLLARAVVVVDEQGKVVYSELVPEITQEPDYEKALQALLQFSQVSAQPLLQDKTKGLGTLTFERLNVTLGPSIPNRGVEKVQHYSIVYPR